jgi:hypothetical protein
MFKNTGSESACVVLCFLFYSVDAVFLMLFMRRLSVLYKDPKLSVFDSVALSAAGGWRGKGDVAMRIQL